jgi:cell division protein FtsI/penicillin-binding protein 2
MAIGQSFLLATPLQMANVAAILANGGTNWRTYLVKRVTTADGVTIQESEPKARGRLSASASNIETVRQTLLAAVQATDGTGHRAAVRGLSVAGKTGTAEFDVYEDGQRRRINRAWFIGFAPYENPQFALSVLIEEGDSGGHTAAPVAGQIFAGLYGTSVEAGSVGDRGLYAD